MTNRYHRIAGTVSSAIADFAAHPGVQFAVLAGCVVWLAVGGSENALASTLTIGGFILTQMVLNQQRRRESALHLKIDELIRSTGGARDELTGAERHPEDEIDRLRSEGERKAGT